MSRSLLSKTSRLGDVNPVAGAVYGADSLQDETGLQVGGSAAQVQAITIGGTPAATNVLTINIGEDSGSLVTTSVTLDATTGASTTTAAAALADAINAKPGISNLVFATAGGAFVGVVGRQKGVGATFSMTGSATGGGATLTVGAISVNAGDATPIPFGVMVERSTSTKVAGSTFIGSAIGSGTYTPQKMTSVDIDATFALVAGDAISITVSGDFDGKGQKSYSADVIFDTSEAQTVTNMTNALNAVLPASSVEVVNTTGVMVLTAEVAGVGFDVTGGVTESGTSAAITFTETVANSTPLGGGVALKSHTIEQNDSGVTEYEGGDTFSGMTEGKVYVLLDDDITVSEGDACFVRVTAVSPEQVGAFSNVSDGGDNLPISAFGFKGIWVGGNITDMNGSNVAPLYISRA